MTNIQNRRVVNGWSRKDLAEKTGLTVGQIQTVENDGRYTWETIKALSQAFNLSYTSLGLNIPTAREMDNKLWTTFGRYIRLRDSRGGEIGLCISCGKMVHYKDADAGHYISRNYKAVKYNEKNVNLQCKRCNKHMYGNIVSYRKGLCKKISTSAVENLEKIMDAPNPLDRDLLWEMTKFYKEEVKQMEVDQSYSPKSFN